MWFAMTCNAGNIDIHFLRDRQQASLPFVKAGTNQLKNFLDPIRDYWFIILHLPIGSWRHVIFYSDELSKKNTIKGNKLMKIITHLLCYNKRQCKYCVKQFGDC